MQRMGFSLVYERSGCLFKVCVSISFFQSELGGKIAEKHTEPELHCFRQTLVLLLEILLWQAHQSGSLPRALKH